MLLNCGVGEDSWESLGLQGDQINPSWRKSVLNIHWKDWWWSWSSNTLAIWCEELTHLKRPWCWEKLKAGGEEDDRRWNGWMESSTRWPWVWASSGSWWWTEKPGVLQSMGSQRVRHNWATELNWTELSLCEAVVWGGCSQASLPNSLWWYHLGTHRINQDECIYTIENGKALKSNPFWGNLVNWHTYKISQPSKCFSLIWCLTEIFWS